MTISSSAKSARVPVALGGDLMFWGGLLISWTAQYSAGLLERDGSIIIATMGFSIAGFACVGAALMLELSGSQKVSMHLARSAAILLLLVRIILTGVWLGVALFFTPLWLGKTLYVASALMTGWSAYSIKCSLANHKQGQAS
jgi:hypothetical protein